MKTILLVILATGLLTCCAFGYDPPEVIGALPGPFNLNMNFCRVADTNGDGCDELLVFYQDSQAENPNSRYQLFLGGENMFDEIERTFDPVDQNERIIFTVCAYTNISPDLQNVIGIHYYNPDDPETHKAVSRIKFFDAGAPDEREPLFGFSRINGQDPIIFTHSANRLYPFDVNGDGWNDIITDVTRENGKHFDIYHGGADFDTIPDWKAFFDRRNMGMMEYYLKTASTFTIVR